MWIKYFGMGLAIYVVAEVAVAALRQWFKVTIGQ
jgi:hypothetical protein